nr:SDR family NAD(P)-dependent oxidoreductase [Pseudomonadota bacterium]
RQSNYVYGAAKAMVSVFLQGLRGRLHSAGVKVVDIKPGFVDTPMTAGIKKGLLWAQPETIAKGIIRAIDKNKASVYLPWFWIGIMTIIRMIPEFVFKKIKL